MRVSDDDLRGALADRPVSRQACPTADALGAAAAGTLPAAEREAVIEHVARCGECAGEVRALAPLRPWAEAAAARLQPVHAWWRTWPVWAAAAVVLLALPLVVRQQREPAPAALRAQEPPVLRSLLPEGASLRREACVLRWSDLGARYSVSVLGKDLSPLASADGLERPEYTLPEDALAGVPPGGEIVWSVEARWPDGRRLASPTFVDRLE